MNNSSLVERQLFYTTSEEEAEWELLEARWRGSVYFSAECYEEALTAQVDAFKTEMSCLEATQSPRSQWREWE